MQVLSEQNTVATFDPISLSSTNLGVFIWLSDMSNKCNVYFASMVNLFSNVITA